MGLGSVISGAARIGSGAVKALSGVGSGSSNWLPLAGSIAGTALPVVGGLYNAFQANRTAQNVNLLNYKQAKEFAQNSLQWRVEDGRKAGLHPLAAIGSSVSFGAPSVVGADTSSVGSVLSDMGQNISRAIDASQTREQRQREIARQQALQDLDLKLRLDKFALDQREVASRIALNNARAKAEESSLKNSVKSSSFMRGAQPRSIPRPSVSSRGKFSVANVAGDKRPNLFTVYRGPDGENVHLISEEAADSMENLWGLGEVYAYGLLAHKWYKDYMTALGKKHRKKYPGLSNVIDNINYALSQ